MTNKWDTDGTLTFLDGDVLYAADLNDTIEASAMPIGSVTNWCKTYGTADSGTTDATTANKLVQSGQNFNTTVVVGMIVYNTTDSTFAYVTAVDSDTTLSLSSDIMTSGETYIIYKTPNLKSGWVECNGQTLSDADSPFNGETIPNLNKTVTLDSGTTTTIPNDIAVITDTSQSWTTNEWAGYILSINSGQSKRLILSNTATALTLSESVYWPSNIDYAIIDVPRFLRGALTSGTISGDVEHVAQILEQVNMVAFDEGTGTTDNLFDGIEMYHANGVSDTNFNTDAEGPGWSKLFSALPAYYETVKIMRVK